MQHVRMFYMFMLGPLGEFLGVFDYLIKNQYILEHLKSTCC
jgi:hypothetical protein